jgi:hypothetical protein
VKRAYPRSALTGGSTEILNLEPGEWVRVRPAEEIFATLDERGKFRGLFFMPEMLKFTGKKFRVYKKVKIISLESTGEMRRLVSPTVFLENVYCDGEFHEGCDRSCFCFWREVWLRRESP